ncbi:MAG: septal ring lytic transglycosylase RlpA family protein [Hyphomonadaceae bacterium]|nr:septal ring lytic transglycosylase RlpA family protein [Hyphomonadaceae bacterium]
MARGLEIALVSALAFGVCGTAAAQAPIVYAGQGQRPTAAEAASMPVQTASLTGGDDASYGYGAQSRAGQAVIDVRRVPSTARRQPQAPLVVAPSRAEETQAPRGQRPEWLATEQVGPPYEANGRVYVPTPEPGYSETGTASWYGPQFHGQRAANGEIFDQDGLTAAHPTLPLNSLVQVTNLANGRELIVRVTDRGPFARGRLIDLSRGAARALGFETQGQTQVHVRYLGPAPRRVEAEAPASSPPPVDDGPASLLPPPEPEGRTDLAEAPRVSPATADGGYFVQVGAFSDMSNVQRVRESASAAGPVVVDTRSTASGGELFRVRVGPWASREDADAARQTLASMGFGDSVVAQR